VAIRPLISRVMVMKASSTLVAFLALVSRNGIPKPSANSYRCCKAARAHTVCRVWREDSGEWGQSVVEEEEEQEGS
jgi:hypothetical protein